MKKNSTSAVLVDWSVLKIHAVRGFGNCSFFNNLVVSQSLDLKGENLSVCASICYMYKAESGIFAASLLPHSSALRSFDLFRQWQLTSNSYLILLYAQQHIRPLLFMLLSDDHLSTWLQVHAVSAISFFTDLLHVILWPSSLLLPYTEESISGNLLGLHSESYSAFFF